MIAEFKYTLCKDYGLHPVNVVQCCSHSSHSQRPASPIWVFPTTDQAYDQSAFDNWVARLFYRPTLIFTLMISRILYWM